MAALRRQGTNAEYRLVDERIVARKPKSLDFAASAALPLTSITAYEMLFDRLGVGRGASNGRSLLVIGGAGGVGSITIQLAGDLTELTVIATASRPESKDWVTELGAHHAVDHSQSIPEQVKALGFKGVDYVFSTTMSDRHWAAIAEIIAPQGKVGLIDDPEPIDGHMPRSRAAARSARPSWPASERDRAAAEKEIATISLIHVCGRASGMGPNRTETQRVSPSRM